MTVREMVRAAQSEIRSGDLSPTRASELQNTLSALLGNCNDEMRAADLEYKRVLLAAMNTHEKANRARIEAETSPEYSRWREAKDTRDLTVELIRSLRQYLRNAAEEMRLTR